MAALLTVFCNILQDPLNSLSRDDARLLKVAAGLMERILSSGIMSEKEASNVKVVANFMAELSWLAESAVRKARHESDTDLTPGQ
jgi:ribosomal protein L11 methylase PrmA